MSLTCIQYHETCDDWIGGCTLHRFCVNPYFKSDPSLHEKQRNFSRKPWPLSQQAKEASNLLSPEEFSLYLSLADSDEGWLVTEAGPGELMVKYDSLPS